jgi:hypothetical protein
MKLTIVLAAVFSYLLLTFACNTSSSQQTSAFVNATPTPAVSDTPKQPAAANTPNANTAAAATPAAASSTNPHAVDIDGKAIPDQSTAEPTKPIILAKDSEDAKNGEMKKEAAFDHAKHSTDASYSVDGKAAVGCAECHHTDQPKAPAGQEYLKKLERTEMLTSEGLKKSTQAVKSCRVCHFQASAEPTDEYPPDSITYAKGSGKAATKDKILNDEAYHLNCNTCHDQALKNKTRAKPAKAPAACADCHVQKKPS